MFRYRIGVLFNFKHGFNKIVTNLASWSVILTKSLASHRIQVALMIALEKMNVLYSSGKCSVKVDDLIVVV
jgi:hypothetical protein